MSGVPLCIPTACGHKALWVRVVALGTTTSGSRATCLAATVCLTRAAEYISEPPTSSRRRRYYKEYNYHTVVMAASFRNAGEIRQLAG